MTILNTYDFLRTTPNTEKTYVIFGRHGESEGNALRKVGGSSSLANLDLTERGREDAQKLGKALAPFKDLIKASYTSPLKRAHQTALIVLQTMGLSDAIPLQEDERIKEKFFGEAIDGQSEEIYKKFAAMEIAETKEMNFSQKWTYTVVEDAESFQEIYTRIKSFMFSAATQHPGQIIVVFGHKVSSIKVPTMGALAEEGIEVDYRDPPFNDPKNGSTAVFEVDAKNEKVHLVAIDGFSLSFLATQKV